jgi:hypothetical protein
MRIRVFRYIEEVDAFDVTEQYASLVDLIGLAEWNPVVWIGRYFSLDNDFGEHWFDNWDAREAQRELAEKHGLDANKLLIIDPERFCNGADGPCHSPEMRKRQLCHARAASRSETFIGLHVFEERDEALSACEVGRS